MNTVIHVQIPVDMGGCVDNQCKVCANTFCSMRACKHARTYMSCCGKAICMGCLSKWCSQCTCDRDCEQIVSVCCFCRQISPLTAMELFYGLKHQTCKECSERKDEDD